MSKLSDYLMNNTPAANVPEGAAPGYEDDGSSDDSGFSASSIQNAASSILDALSHPSFLQGGTVIAPDYTPRQLDDDASDVPIQEANPTYQPYAASTALNNFIQDHTTVIAPNYTPRPLDDSVYSDIPGTPVAGGRFGEQEDESVRDERMKDSADYMAANWPRLYGGAVGAAEGFANVVGGIQNAVGGGNGILHNVQRAEEGMQDYRDQWNNEYGDSYFLNPNKFATDVGSGIGSTAPIMALSALMPGAAVAGGTRALTAALSRAGLGRLAMSKAGQALIADTVRSPISSLADSLSEYGTVVNDMMQSGMSEDEARRRAIPMFFKNMALDTFTVPLELGVMKGGKGIATGLLGRGAEEGIGKSLAKGAARTGMLAGASGLTEGYQEGAQNALENDVQGKRDGGWYNPFTWTNEDWEAARGGFVGGALMGIPGNVAAGFHPEAKQAPLSAESQEQAQSIKDTLSHGKPKGMSNAAYNAYIELANSGNPDLIKQAASSLESFQESQGNGSSENTDDAATEAYKDYETYDQKQEIENFLNNNTVEQIGGEDNYNWLVGVLRNGTPEEVQKAYDNVVAAEKATAEMEAKNRAAQAVPAKTGNNTIDTIIAAAQQYGDDPKALISVGARESGGDDINAIGKSVEGNNWFQIEPATAEAYGVDKIYPDWETDPTENIYAAALILRKKTDEANGDVFQGMHNYNGGGDPDYDSKVQATYNSLGDLSGVASDSGNVSAPDQQYYDLSDQMTPQVDGMDPNTMAKMNLLARDFYQKYGHRLLVTSLKRNGDGSSYHDEGHAFDFSDDFLEQNPDARDWLVQQGEKYGLKGLDEFSHPVATTDGGNVHFTDHGGPVPGGTSGAVTGKITSDDGQFDRELDQAAQEAKSDMDRIQAQSDQAMNEIMNDDSAEKTAQEAQEDAENAQKQAEESQQSTQDTVIPDVAQTIRDTSNNIDEINALDGMFTKDGNGNDKFIDTPENRDFIKANYKDEITKAVNDAMSKKKAPIATPVPKNKQQTPHARLGRILATHDRKDPKFKEYMSTFRNGTEQEQRKLADDLQSTQELERANSLKGNPLTSQQVQNTLQNVPQQGAEAPEQPEQVNTPVQAKESLETQKKRNAYLSKKQKLMERVPAGRTVKVHASTNDAGFDATYKIVPAGDITASHNTDYAVNDLYPAELQPRDRNRPQMRGQVEKMAKTMKPELLAESQFVNEGAPIVNNSGVVLNGNGRVMAIQKAYQGLTDSHKKSAKAYKDFLASIAPSLGIAPEKVQSMDHPVLVRQAADDADTNAIINSTEGGAKLGGAEQAKTDADRLKLSTLEQFVDNGTGEFMNPSNREFRRTAAKDIFSDAEGNSVFNANGELSPIGALRIRNAIFAKAYKDDYLLTQLSEATDNNSKNIMNAMIAAAPEVAKVNEGIKEGNLYPDYDISNVITKTAKTIMSLRNEGKPLSFHLQETSLFSQGESEAERLVLEFIERNKFKSRTIADMYKAVCDRIFAVGSPKQSKLFDSTEAPRISFENIISNAIQEVEHGQSLFDTTEEKPAEKAVSEVPDNRQAEPAGSGRVHQQEAGRVQSQEKEGNEVDEKSKQSNHVNAEPQQTESKDKESSHAEEGPQSDVQEEISKFHNVLNDEKSTPKQVIDAYKSVADKAIANANGSRKNAKMGDKIVTDEYQYLTNSKHWDTFMNEDGGRYWHEVATINADAHKTLRTIVKTTEKEATPKAEQPKETKPTEQPKEKPAGGFTDDEIKTLTDRGFTRWTKKLPNGKVIDRLYINPEYLGLELTRYKSGNISSAKFNGETISNSEARRIEGTKCYVDVATKEVVCDRDDLKQAAQEVVDDALSKEKSQVLAQTETKKAVPKDDVAVTGDEFGKYKNLKELRAKAKAYYKEHLQGTSVHNPILGDVELKDDSIDFTGKGISKAVSTSAKENKLLLIKYLPQLIENANEVASQPNVKDKREAKQYTYLMTHAIVGGKQENVIVTIFTDANGNKYYNHILNDEENKKRPPVYPAQAANKSDGIPAMREPFSTSIIPQKAEKWNKPDELRNQLSDAPKVDTKYSVREANDQLTRSKEDLKAEIKDAFPNAKEIKDEGYRMTFTMSNGSHIVVDVKNEILLTDKELAQAKKDHHIDDNGNVVVEGYAQLHGKDAYMALSQGSRENTGFHEAYHLAEGAVLTDREKATIKKAIPDAEKRADKYAEWVEARKRGRGTAWGKLFQKIKDFAAKMKKIFTGTETVNNIFRQIESGRVWERNVREQGTKQSNQPLYQAKHIVSTFADKINLNRFVNAVLTHNEKSLIMHLGKVDADEAVAIKEATGYDVSNYEHVWRSNDVRHAQKRHGIDTETASDQIGLSPEEMVDALKVISAPDKIERGSINKEGPSIRYIKADNNGQLTIVEVVRSKRKTLDIKTMWKKRAEKLHGDYALQDTSETALDATSSTTENVAHNTDNVNGEKHYSIRKPKDAADEAQEKAEQAAEDTAVTMKDILAAARKILPIYTRSKIHYNSRATYRYDEHGRAGFVPSNYTLGDIGASIALHLDHVAQLKGANVELTNDVLDELEIEQRAAKKYKQEAPKAMTPVEARREGVKEFGRIYFQDPARAKEKYPKYYDIFEKTLDGMPEEKAAVEKILELEAQRAAQNPLLLATAGLSLADDRKKPKTVKERLNTAWARFYRTMVDETDPLRQITKCIEMELGKKLADEKDPHKRAVMCNSVAEGRASMLLFADNKAANLAYLNKIYKGAIRDKVTFEDVLNTLRKVRTEDIKKAAAKDVETYFGMYLVAQRTEEIVKTHKNYVRPEGYSHENCLRIIAEAPEAIRKAAQLYWKYNRNLVNIMEAEGLISEKQAAGLRKYEKYCPMYRDMSEHRTFDDELPTITAGRGFINQSSGIKKLKGGSILAVINPIDSMVSMTTALIARCERNDVAKVMVQSAEDHPGLGRIIVKDPSLFRADASKCAFTVMIAGKKTVYRTTPELYQALQEMSTNSAAFLTNVFGKFTDALRFGATNTPSFMVRNFIRDTLSASVNARYGKFVPIVDSIRGMKALKGDADFRAKFYGQGVPMDTYIRRDIRGAKQYKDKVQKSLKRYPLGIRQLMALSRSLVHKYNDVGEALEQGTRAGAMLNALKAGASDFEAGQEARDVTVNFSRHGSFGKKVNRYVPFFNASIQGTDKVIRTFLENPKRASLATCLYIILPTIILWAINHDDDWYKELDDNTKYTNWAVHIPGTDYHWLIPKPQEVGIGFGSGVEAVLNQMLNEDPHAMKAWARQFAEVVTPGIIMTALRPVLEWRYNYSEWTGRKLVPERLSKLPPEQQYTTATSELAKLMSQFAGKYVGLSPIAIDNFFSGWFGSLGRMSANALNKPIDAIRGSSRPPEPARYWYESPFIGSFARQDGQNSVYVERFYQLAEDMEMDYKRSDSYAKNKGKKGAPIPASLKAAQTCMKTMTKINKDIRSIKDDPKMDPETKRKRIDAAYTKMRTYAKKFVTQFDK